MKPFYMKIGEDQFSKTFSLYMFQERDNLKLKVINYILSENGKFI